MLLDRPGADPACRLAATGWQVSTPSTGRRPELDFMRAFVVAGLVVFHSAVVFARVRHGLSPTRGLAPGLPSSCCGVRCGGCRCCSWSRGWVRVMPCVRVRPGHSRGSAWPGWPGQRGAGAQRGVQAGPRRHRPEGPGRPDRRAARLWPPGAHWRRLRPCGRGPGRHRWPGRRSWRWSGIGPAAAAGRHRAGLARPCGARGRNRPVPAPGMCAGCAAPLGRCALPSRDVPFTTGPESPTAAPLPAPPSRSGPGV
jgi:hypothetical protein